MFCQEASWQGYHYCHLEAAVITHSINISLCSTSLFSKHPHNSPPPTTTVRLTYLDYLAVTLLTANKLSGLNPGLWWALLMGISFLRLPVVVTLMRFSLSVWRVKGQILGWVTAWSLCGNLSGWASHPGNPWFSRLTFSHLAQLCSSWYLWFEPSF